MRLVITAFGSRGDVEPYIALGRGLQQRGHSVCIATHGVFEEFVRSYDFDHYTIPGDPRKYTLSLIEAGTNPVRHFSAVGKMIHEIYEPLQRSLQTVCVNADVIIDGGHDFGTYNAVALHKPLVIARLLPVFPWNSIIPTPLWPSTHRGGPRYNLCTYWCNNLFTALFCARTFLGANRRVFGLSSHEWNLANQKHLSEGLRLDIWHLASQL